MPESVSDYEIIEERESEIDKLLQSMDALKPNLDKAPELRDSWWDVYEEGIVGLDRDTAYKHLKEFTFALKNSRGQA